MQTGDGLLVRLLPIGTIPLAAFTALCAAARKFGNEIVEITARGSIQVRGLDAASVPHFAAAIGALGIAAADGVAVHSNPLAGLDANEIFDAGNLAADLRRALAERALAVKLAPKVSVALNSGGALNLDRLSADVQLRGALINGDVALQVSVGGDGASAMHLQFVAPTDEVETAIRLLEVVAQRGRAVRARDILADEGIAPFQQAFSSCPALCRASTSYQVAKDVDGRDKPGHDGSGAGRVAVGMHRLLDGSFAYGIGLAFGHAEASAIERLVEAAGAAGAAGIRAAPGARSS